MSGVKAKLALMQGNEEIGKSADAIEVPSIGDTDASVVKASCHVEE